MQCCQQMPFFSEGDIVRNTAFMYMDLDSQSKIACYSMALLFIKKTDYIGSHVTTLLAYCFAMVW